METVLRELQYASRQLRRSLGFSSSAVLMLALGIGATTATFSIVEGVLLRPLPFPDPTRLVALSDTVERVNHYMVCSCKHRDRERKKGTVF